MITFYKAGDKIIASYTTRNDSIQWLLDKLKNDEEYDFQKTFLFSKKNLAKPLPEQFEVISDNNFSTDNDELLDIIKPVNFNFAELHGNYYLVCKGVLTNNFDIYIDKEIEITTELFLVESDISIFRKIQDLIKEDVYIGGTNQYAISTLTYIELINSFPNSYEKKLYADAKITNLIKEFFSTTKDIDKKFQKYLNKKETKKGLDLIKTFKKPELLKYLYIVKLTTIL